MKPVAWIDPFDLERLPLYDCWVNGQEHKNSVPLYIHPVKELTDEKIIEVYNEILIHDQKSCIKFARAILKKAQEK